ncbi:unnamed protein product [Porites lobata]|uniref:ALOG domain-containing protein n=1 Tax=Porites lobata TaxID=104759 RepID=A0ABN8R5J7_9CNID|nr:unnamed protein product [Porites lobata]
MPLTALSSESIDLVTLQRSGGKCISIVLAVPGARFYTNEINLALSRAVRSSQPVKLSGPLRQELEHWLFLETWNGFLPWLSKKHCHFRLFSDSSSFAWGGVLSPGAITVSTSDYWDSSVIGADIATKETLALNNALQSFGNTVRNSWVDAFVDSQVLLHSWNRRGSHSHSLVPALKCLFQTTMHLNVDLHVYYVPGPENPADSPSRRLSFQDSRLSPKTWDLVQSLYGGPKVNALGVNVFAQSPNLYRPEIFSNPYLFLPICLIPKLFKHLNSLKLPYTLVVPDVIPRRFWWPLLLSACSSSSLLASKGASGVILTPSRDGILVSPTSACLENKSGSRLQQLTQTANTSSYSKQKSSLRVEFETFLASLPNTKSIYSATPADVSRFLIWKDRHGKRVVHVAECVNAPNQDASDSGCPKRLAFKTVDSYIGKLRAIFNETGRSGEWNSMLGFGNPAASSPVQGYLKALSEEQLRAHIVPKQAVPFFLLKLLLLARLWDRKMADPAVSPSALFILARDQAFFKTLFFSADRGSDLGCVKTAEIMPRLKYYLKDAKIDEGETLYGFHSGSAITLALSGSQLTDVMSHVGWSNKGTALYYMKLAEVLREGSPSDLLSSNELAASASTTLYADLNRLKDFVSAFPRS